MSRTPKDAAAEIVKLTLQAAQDREALDRLRAELAAVTARAEAAEKVLRAQAARAELDVPPSWKDMLEADVVEMITAEALKKGLSFEDTCRAYVKYAASRKRALIKYENDVKDIKIRKPSIIERRG